MVDGMVLPLLRLVLKPNWIYNESEGKKTPIGVMGHIIMTCGMVDGAIPTTKEGCVGCGWWYGLFFLFFPVKNSQDCGF